MKYKTKQDLYKDVWNAMDACNASGLIHSFPAMVDAIGEFEGTRGDCVNNHPIVIAMADKLLQLAGTAALGDATWNAYSAIRKEIE